MTAVLHRRRRSSAGWTPILSCLAAVLVAAVVGGTVTDTDPGSWYSGVSQPSWNPPDWLFGPVWTALYVMMAVAAWRVWQRTGSAASPPMIAWWVQLALNLAWTLVFFGLESMWGGVVVIAAMWVAIVVTIVRFRPVDATAAALLAPYLVW